ncbi:hypothetical protein BDF22DRAFT_684506, partial [Syncephalis plumigaleata]
MLFNLNAISKSLLCALVLGSAVDIVAGSGGLFKGFYNAVYGKQDEFTKNGFKLQRHEFNVPENDGVYAYGQYTSARGVPPMDAILVCRKFGKQYTPYYLINRLYNAPNNSPLRGLKDNFPKLHKRFETSGEYCFILENRCDKNWWTEMSTIETLPFGYKRWAFSQIISTIREMKNENLFLQTSIDSVCFNSGKVVFSNLSKVASKYLRELNPTNAVQANEMVKEINQKMFELLGLFHSKIYDEGGKNEEQVRTLYDDLKLECDLNQGSSPPNYLRHDKPPPYISITMPQTVNNRAALPQAAGRPPLTRSMS